MAGVGRTIVYKGQEMPFAQYHALKAQEDAALRKQEETARGQLSPTGQTIGPRGDTTTMYGTPRAGGAYGSGSGGGGADDGAAQRAHELAMMREREAAGTRARDAAFRQYQSVSGGGNEGGGQQGMGADESAARGAAFARAKEQSGQIARSSLAGLRNALGRRGITGGGYANMRTAEALAPAADQLQDFTREGLIQDYRRIGDIADRDVSAGLTRRGQDISKQQSLLSLLKVGGLY